MIVKIDYTNWKGERRFRRIQPTGEFMFGSDKFHKEPQWLMVAIDLEKWEKRTFAMKDIHSWVPEENPLIKDMI